MQRHAVAAFVVFHLVAVLVLSLPYRPKSSSPAVRTLSLAVLAVRDGFAPYGLTFGPRQGWRMFGRVATEQARFEIDLRVDGQWQPLYRAQSSEHAWQASLLRQERMRAAMDGFEDEEHPERYAHLVDTLTARARAEALPGDRIRFRMQGVRIPPPAELVERGELVETRVFWPEERPL